MMKFRHDINGLRAIAVIGVVFFHFNSTWVPGGFAGVDVFFAISGFLMTGIIFNGIENNDFNLFKFYVARANRIIPALFVLCLILLIFGWFFINPSDYRILGKHLVSSIGFFSNIIYLRESGYFDAASHEKWLLHTWSLAAEWQFYLLYPTILITLKRFLSLQNLKRFIVIATLISFILSIIATIHRPEPSFYLLPTRMWEMLVGGIAFLYPWNISEQNKKPIEIFGLALILCSYAFISSETSWPGYLALFPVLGVYLMTLANQQSSMITNNAIFQYLGKWSYSIYLWHWPIVVFGYHFNIQGWLFYGLALSITLGFLSFTFIENLKLKLFSNWSDTLKIKPLYMVILISTLGFLVFKMLEGRNGWIALQDEKTKLTYNILSLTKPDTLSWGASDDGKQDFTDCRFNVGSITQKIKLRLNACYLKHGQGVLILGDSHAKDLFGMVSSRFTNNFLVGITSTIGCRAHTQKEQCPFKEVANFLSESKIIKHVIYEQAGFYLMKNGTKQGNRAMFQNIPLDKEIIGISLNESHIRRTFDYLNTLAKFTNVTWFGSRFEPHITKSMILKRKCDYPYHFRAGQIELFNKLDHYIANKTNNTKINFLSQNKTLSYHFPDDFMNCKNTLWNDGDHLTAYGEEKLGRRLPANFLEFDF